MKRHKTERFTLPRWARWTLYASAISSLLSGAGWLVLHHFVQVDSDFGLQAHPLEHPSLVVHGIAAALLTWCFGLVWLGHVRRAWGRRLNRRSGGTMVALLGWLALSGLGLYYLADEQWRAAASAGHWVVGLVAAGWLPFHIWRGRRAVRARSASQ